MRKHRPWRFCVAGCVLGGGLLGLAIVLGLHSDISLQAILTDPQQNPFLTAGLLLLFYMLKSLTIFFPLIILEMAAGYLFPAPMALVINFLGIWIALTIPYWIGRALGLRQISKLTRKYPKLQAILEKQSSHSVFLCFFLRVISCLPGDLVTMYLGATHTPFFQNLLGGALGILPGMILATFMGRSIQDPSSPAFWISAALSVALAVLSTALYYAYLKRQKGREDHI
ncbi:TVP38/TMEM64 family protein [Dysosmobacter sp.]|jgi:uncharacterized membrane protein YdjX (TVP38/TMEM64 family)|uniref:TVP38/TMEM64 family protein n=1 Tax=Dysosmobacter sp. TaxID=2591382 RepID=UPI003D8FC6F0